MDRELLVAIEECINSGYTAPAEIEGPKPERICKVDPALMQQIAAEAERDRKRKSEEADTGSALYREVVIPWIRRLQDERFLKKNGEIREAKFYDYACIDKTTWSDFKWGKVKPSKKTLQKLIFALKLGKTEAVEFLSKGNCVLEPEKDPQDLVICCILDYEESRNIRYTVDDVMEILDTCRNWGRTSYDSIYDTPEMIAERKDKEKKE